MNQCKNMSFSVWLIDTVCYNSCSVLLNRMQNILFTHFYVNLVENIDLCKQNNSPVIADTAIDVQSTLYHVYSQRAARNSWMNGRPVSHGPLRRCGNLTGPIKRVYYWDDVYPICVSALRRVVGRHCRLSGACNPRWPRDILDLLRARPPPVAAIRCRGNVSPRAGDLEAR